MRHTPAQGSGPNRWLSLGLGLAAAGLLAGCSSLRPYREQAADMRQSYLAGDYPAAAAAARRMAEKRHGTGDALVWQLEAGSTARAAGDYAGSNAALEEAHALVRAYDQRASISVRDFGAEAGAIALNENVLPYKGYAYDRIMLYTYRALNHMALGRPQAARVEFRRAYERQQDAVAQFQRAIREAHNEAGSNVALANQVAQSSSFRSQWQSTYGDLDKYRGYQNYVNPATTYLEGLLLLGIGDGSDLERAREDFERVASMTGNRVNTELQAVRARVGGNRPTPTVFVVYETGIGPAREEIRFSLGIPLDRETIVLAAAFPVLRFQRRPPDSLRLGPPGAPAAVTARLADLDSIVAAEFRERMAATVVRTLAGAVVKAVAQHEARKRGGELGWIAAAAYTVVSSQADTRTWQTLPAEFQTAALPMPANRRLRLSSARGYGTVEVVLPDCDLVLVYAKSVAPGRLSAHCIKLR